MIAENVQDLFVRNFVRKERQERASFELRHPQKLMRVLATLVFSFSVCQAAAQNLSLAEIIRIRELDAAQLNLFSTTKGFALKEEKEDAWIISYTYRSQLDKSVWFIETFPKSETGWQMVYYYFRGKEIHAEFKKQIEAEGFTFSRTTELQYGVAHNIFIKDDYEIDLVTDRSAGLKPSYTLMYYKRMSSSK